MKNLICLGLLGLLLTVPVVFAKDVAGVKLADTLLLIGSPQKLVLNGAGVRKKFFVKVYVGALYLPARTNDIDAVLKQPGPAAIHMHFLHSEVSKKKLVKGWSDGFSANSSNAEHARLKSRLDHFNGMFRTVKRGEVIHLDYVPGVGTQVTINKERRGVIKGADFWRAVLRIWLGAKPADSNLKRAMLGHAN